MKQVTFIVPSSVWIAGGYLDAAYGRHAEVQLQFRQQGRGKQVIVTAPVRIAVDIYKYLRDRAGPQYGDAYARRAAGRAAEGLRPLLLAEGEQLL
ncbi:MAG TPA: hypothetical protein VFQ38_17235 [Longimicrobiales bacterium]|nr:hypothetical protein [Longimicrobiales bacterium]